jgi:uncharacterized lipoprotein YajG
MLKRFFSILVGLVFLGALAGCPATMQTGTTPAQQAVNLTATSCKNIDAAIVATDQAVVAGVLKGQDARNALKGLTAAQAGCVAALGSIQAANAAASGAK